MGDDAGSLGGSSTPARPTANTDVSVQALSADAARVVAFDEIPALKHHSFVGAPFTITRAERDAFEGLTWIDYAYPDPDPVEFPSDIVEGFHTLAMLDAVSSLVMRFDPATCYAYNYGLDRVRFTAPIMIGDPVSSRFEVLDVRPRNDGLLVLRRCTLHIEDRQALIADWWVYVLPRRT